MPLPRKSRASSRNVKPLPAPIDADDHQDACDARFVLGCMGHRRRRCVGCKRNTVTPGYICWSCGVDNSRNTEEC